jgi:REP element-mobilizing transposase RayT
MTTRRLAGYDYSQPAGYFVTINSWKRKEIFSSIIDQKIVLSELGRLIHRCWIDLPKHFETIELGDFSIMPNHFHGIIIINYSIRDRFLPSASTRSNFVCSENLVGAKHASHLPSSSGTTRGSLSAIIQAFKSSSTRSIHKNTEYQEIIWQRSFYDHIIRNEKELSKLSEYISINPYDWDEKIFHEFLKKENP